MKKSVMLLVFCLALSLSVLAFGGSAPEKKSTVSSDQTTKSQVVSQTKVSRLLIDDFESNSLSSPRQWWTFDLQTAAPVSNNGLTAGDLSVLGEVGKYSLALSGQAKNWYAGGAGTYLAKENQDLSVFDSVQIDIYGYGPGSGTLKIELLDDDNKNWQAEQDPNKSYVPVYDDKYVYDLNVDWVGWNRLTIPLADFVDENSGVGDNIWNINQAAGSGGLLQLQFICLGAKGDANIKYNIDNVFLLVDKAGN